MRRAEETMNDKEVFLNIGCGDHRLDGFVNIDLDSTSADLKVDVTEGLPFEPGSVAGVRCEHFLEHLSKPHAFRFFREVRRVLRPGGVFRVSTPDLRALCEAYLNRQKMEWESPFYDWISSRAEMVNVAMRDWGHQWLYDEEELALTALSCGFTSLPVRSKTESNCPRFRDLDYRNNSLTMEFTRPVVEATSGAGDSRPRPLVSILIPAFNPTYFEAALLSALAQDYPQTEIIVSDDSPGDAIAQIVSRYPDKKIRYQRNQHPFGPAENYVELFRLARGDYIKYLNDDDLLHEHCVSEMAGTLERFPHVSLVTSYRQTIDAKGNPLPDLDVTRPIVDKNCIVSGQFGYARLYAIGNFIGEPSTAMFRKDQMQRLAPGLFEVFGTKMPWNVDVVMWLKLLSAGDLAYLIAPLSCFRMHADQLQRDPSNREPLFHSWMELKKIAVRVGMDSAPKTQQVAYAIS